VKRESQPPTCRKSPGEWESVPLPLMIEHGLAQGRLLPGVSPGEVRDLFLAMMHGLTALHLANEPGLPVGSGRFGRLIPAALALFQASWDPEDAHRAHEAAPDDSDPAPHSQE
jgi:hypothetical protein